MRADFHRRLLALRSVNLVQITLRSLHISSRNVEAGLERANEQIGSDWLVQMQSAPELCRALRERVTRYR